MPGYYPPTGAQSPLSLVAYRVNSNPTSASIQQTGAAGQRSRLERCLPTDTPVVFLPLTISAMWPYATNQTSRSKLLSAYEVIGPDVFRFEYFYMLSSSQSLERINSARLDCKHRCNGWRDVAAIVVTIAVIDPRSKVLLTNQDIGTLNVGRSVNGATNFLCRFHDRPEPAWHVAYANGRTKLNGITTLPSGAAPRQRFPVFGCTNTIFILISEATNARFSFAHAIL